MTDNACRQQAAEIWLRYFNDCLFARGLITERERNRMTLKIAAPIRRSGKLRRDGRRKQQMV